MNLKDLEIKRRYRSDTCSDIGSAFISKALMCSIVYKRAVGFFSSSALAKASVGISYLCNKPESHIYFVVSPYLSEDDVKAIKKGYENRESIIEKALVRGFNKEIVDNPSKKERLNFLCHLIEENMLDIKVAYRFGNGSIGMYHEKIGVFIDQQGNKVAFEGSLNESDNAYVNNFESIKIYKSWEDNNDALQIEDEFDNLWKDDTHTLRIIDFPEAAKQELFHYRKDVYYKNIDEYLKEEENEKKIRELIEPKKPNKGTHYNLYQYQIDAINEWRKNKCCGIFDMGTGTGKTLTAYRASIELLKVLKYNLAVIVVCPYTHLVEQWVEEQDYFNIDFIVGYSDKRYKNYMLDLKQAVQDFNNKIKPYFYFITTNASFRREKLQNILKSIDGKVLFIGDEVHNFGSPGLTKCLNEKFQFRLGLSATVERHRDEEGTKAIYDYFGPPVIHYGLEEAIKNDVLTRYYYYTIPVALTEEENEKYLELSAKIAKNCRNFNGKFSLTSSGELYALQRARVIAGAEGKILALKKEMMKYREDHNILVYCGTGKINSTNENEEIRQIEAVCQMLGKDLGMHIGRYTSRENSEERKQITERFKMGDDLQALVAIKCLDEGVNIPSIKTAFILASSTNPREYIQRRGRVLRKSKGKNYAYIFDFVTMPALFEDFKKFDFNYLARFKTLAKNEISRIKEFSKLAENEHESDILVNKLTDAFKLNDFEIPEIERIDWSNDDE